MKVQVISVEDRSFEGKEGGKVPAARLTFEVDGKQKTLDTFIPPVVSAALSWTPNQEVEIEEYTDKKNNQRFKTPGVGKGGSGQGGGGRYTPDPHKDALQAAVNMAQTAYRLPEGATEGRPNPKATAESMLLFVEEAVPRILKAFQGSGDLAAPETGGSPQTPAEPEVSPSPESAAQIPSGSRADPTICTKSSDMTHKLVPAPNKDAADRGLVMCEHCLEGGFPERFGVKEEAPVA